jgi:hypothetical protein
MVRSRVSGQCDPVEASAPGVALGRHRQPAPAIGFDGAIPAGAHGGAPPRCESQSPVILASSKAAIQRYAASELVGCTNDAELACPRSTFVVSGRASKIVPTPQRSGSLMVCAFPCVGSDWLRLRTWKSKPMLQPWGHAEIGSLHSLIAQRGRGGGRAPLPCRRGRRPGRCIRPVPPSGPLRSG